LRPEDIAAISVLQEKGMPGAIARTLGVTDCRVSGTGRMDGTGAGMLEYLPAGDPLSSTPVCSVPLTFLSRRLPTRLPSTTAATEANT